MLAYHKQLSYISTGVQMFENPAMKAGEICLYYSHGTELALPLSSSVAWRRYSLTET